MRRQLHFLALITKIVLLGVIGVVPTSLLAQIDTGSIVGVVKDASSGRIAGAEVTLKNLKTGVTHTVTTNDEGAYQFAAIVPGVYSVQASAANFESAISTNIEINVQSRPAIDFTLKVGRSTQVVEVSSEAPVTFFGTASPGRGASDCSRCTCTCPRETSDGHCAQTRAGDRSIAGAQSIATVATSQPRAAPL